MQESSFECDSQRGGSLLLLKEIHDYEIKAQLGKFGILDETQKIKELSGGQLKRVALAIALIKPCDLLILDEPTTGLHIDDISRLIKIINKLVDGGNTVVVIEHNLDVIKVADHIIDLGPEGGAGGGTIVVTGTPEKVAKCEKSYTGQFLKSML